MGRQDPGVETLTVCDPPSTLGWVLMAKCFASKLPERIIPKRQRSVRGGGGWGGVGGCVKEPDRWLVSIPTHHPSRQTAREPRQAYFPLMDPIPRSCSL